MKIGIAATSVIILAPAFLPAPERFAQLALDDLAGAGLGQRGFGEFESAGHFEFRDARPAGSAQSSCSVSFAPGFRTTTAAGTSPHCGSGAETTAHSSTAGCAKMARSTSMDEMFSPPLMMMSFLRSTMWM